MWNMVKKKFKGGSNEEAKLAETKLVLHAMLPQWKGFCPDAKPTEERAQEALLQFNQVLACIGKSILGEWLLLREWKTQKQVMYMMYIMTCFNASTLLM